MRMDNFKMNMDSSFPKLRNAPIIEAIIEIRTKATAEWEEILTTEKIRTLTPDYPEWQTVKGYHFSLNPGIEENERVKENQNWEGLRIFSENKRYVANFNKDYFALSRLEPYENWSAFEKEFFRVWEIYCMVAKPANIYRTGLRFINRISVKGTSVNVEEFINVSKVQFADVPFPMITFQNQCTFSIPNYNYQTNFIQAAQPKNDGVDLILDIDVSSIETIEIGDETLSTKLNEMRWIKNKFFYGNITEKTKEMFS